MPDLYGKLNKEVRIYNYEGVETDTAKVTVDNKTQDISVDVKKVPNELTLTTINGDTYTYDGSEPASFDIRTQVTDKVEEGNNLPVTSDAVKGYVDSKAGALEYVGGEGNFTNINGGVTVKGRLNVDDGITSPTGPTSSTDVANKGYVDDNFVAKVTTPAIVYATNATDGSPRAIPWNTAAVPNSVAIFDDNGCLRTDNPVSGASNYGSQCVNIRYANKNYVAKVTPTTTFDVAYIAKNDGTQSTMLIAQGVYQNTLAQRGAGGRLQVGTPVADSDATPKKYVDDGFVAKQTITTPNQSYLYAYDSNGDKQFQVTGSPNAGSVPVRGNGGVVRVGTPVGVDDATTKKYVDDGFVKSFTGTTSEALLYYTTGGGNNGVIPMQVEPDGNTIAQRRDGGRLSVGTPTEDNDATTKKYVDDADAKKLNLTGGTITGSLAIQGDLTVTGTTTTEKAQTLAVKDSVIITNADGAELGSTLSGIAIKKDGENTYGVMYDPSGDSVKLGLGTLDAKNKFTFNGSGTDGKPIATRDDSSKFTNGNLVRWDGTTKSLVDSGKKVEDFVEKVTNTTTSTKAYIAKTDGSQGTIDVDTGVADNTLAQRGTDGRLQVGAPSDDADATTKEYVDSALKKKLDTYTGTAYYPVVPIMRRRNSSDPSAGYTQAWVQMSVEAINNTAVQRTKKGTVATADPKSDNDATPKKYVEDNFVAKVTTGNRDQAYTTDSNNQQVMMGIGTTAEAWALARRYTNGRLQVGAPSDDADATTKAYVDNLNTITITAGA